MLFRICSTRISQPSWVSYSDCGDQWLSGWSLANVVSIRESEYGGCHWDTASILRYQNMPPNPPTPPPHTVLLHHGTVCLILSYPLIEQLRVGWVGGTTTLSKLSRYLEDIRSQIAAVSHHILQCCFWFSDDDNNNVMSLDIATWGGCVTSPNISSIHLVTFVTLVTHHVNVSQMLFCLCLCLHVNVSRMLRMLSLSLSLSRMLCSGHT